jgi:hypothetical protein
VPTEIDLWGDPPGVSTAHRERVRNRLILRPVIYWSAGLLVSTIIIYWAADPQIGAGVLRNAKVVWVIAIIIGILGFLSGATFLVGAGSERMKSSSGIVTVNGYQVGPDHQAHWPRTVSSVSPACPLRWVYQDSVVALILGVTTLSLHVAAMNINLSRDPDLQQFQSRLWYFAWTPAIYYLGAVWSGVSAAGKTPTLARGRIGHLLVLGAAGAAIHMHLEVSALFLMAALVIIWQGLPRGVYQQVRVQLPPGPDEDPVVTVMRAETTSVPNLGSPYDLMVPRDPDRRPVLSKSDILFRTVLLRLIWLGWLALILWVLPKKADLFALVLWWFLGVITYINLYSVLEGGGPGLRNYWRAPWLFLRGRFVPWLYVGSVLIGCWILSMSLVDQIEFTDVRHIIVLAVSYGLFLVPWPDPERHRLTREV